MITIIGSTALKHHFPDFNRTPNDIDVISHEQKSIIEVYNYLNDKLDISNKRIDFHHHENFKLLLENNNNLFLNPDLLFTLKVSHCAWNIHWDKTMYDIIFLKNKGCQLDKDVYKILFNTWCSIHPNSKKQIKLNVKNEEFFKSNIKRHFNHDWLHEHYAFHNRPLHESIRKDLASPLCSEELWNKLSNDDKLLCALEEIMVIATERFLLTNQVKSTKIAKSKALKQLIISSTKDLFNLFLILNFKELLDLENNHFQMKYTQLLKGL